jgi:hypothetical protein
MKYEYKFVVAIGTLEEVTKKLNEFGKAGWDIQLTEYKTHKLLFRQYVFEGFAKRKI